MGWAALPNTRRKRADRVRHRTDHKHRFRLKAVRRGAGEATENPRVGGSIPPLGTNNHAGSESKFPDANRLNIATVLRPCFGVPRLSHEEDWREDGPLVPNRR